MPWLACSRLLCGIHSAIRISDTSSPGPGEDIPWIGYFCSKPFCAPDVSPDVVRAICAAAYAYPTDGAFQSGPDWDLRPIIGPDSLRAWRAEVPCAPRHGDIMRTTKTVLLGTIFSAGILCVATFPAIAQ